MTDTAGARTNGASHRDAPGHSGAPSHRGAPSHSDAPGHSGLPGARGGAGQRGRSGGRRRFGGGERAMVPPAEFTSYYGRPVVKASPWAADIPAYLFFGGLAAGSSLLGAGADLSGRPGLRRAGRLTAVSAISVSFAALVHDLGRPARFVNMLRVAKPTSPMSMGTWLLTAYGPLAGAAGAAEIAALVPGLLPAKLAKLLAVTGRPTGTLAALVAPAVASYTAVLLADTATPSWHEAFRELPFVFVGSAAAASGGMGIAAAPIGESGPARRLAVGGALLELAADHRMRKSMGITAEPLEQGGAGRLSRASKLLTAAGCLGAALGRRNRLLSVLSGLLMVAGSVCTRFAVFEAGQASARDPKYTIVPQRERMR